jgi:hypothetical protein
MNLPHPRTVQRFIGSSNQFYEGKLDISSFAELYEGSNRDNYAWIAEDATRISGRIVYVEKINQLMGYVRKLSMKTFLIILIKSYYFLYYFRVKWITVT